MPVHGQFLTQQPDGSLVPAPVLEVDAQTQDTRDRIRRPSIALDVIFHQMHVLGAGYCTETLDPHRGEVADRLTTHLRAVIEELSEFHNEESRRHLKRLRALDEKLDGSAG